VRNRLLILRKYRLWRAAVTVTITQVVRLLLLPLFRPTAGTIGLHFRGLVDGWRGRSGRTVEPGENSSSSEERKLRGES
jgi:hypothetical protein